MIALLLILLGSNSLQYKDRIALEHDLKVIVEQRIQEQKDKTKEQEAMYLARIVESADNVATRIKLSDLTREIEELKRSAKKRH